MRKFFFILAICLFTLAGCSNSQWIGFYYPDKNNIGDESKWIIQKGFNNIDECRDWIDEIAGSNNNYDYECGFNCKTESGLNICEKTEK